MLSIKTVLMVTQVCLFLILGPFLQALANAQRRRVPCDDAVAAVAPANKPWDRNEATNTCSPAWHYITECNSRGCRPTRPRQRSLIQFQSSRGIMEEQTEEVTEDAASVIANATNNSKQKESGFLPNWRTPISRALRRAENVVLWVWNRAGHHSDKALVFIQTTRHWAVSRVGAAEFAIWASFLGVIGLVVCLLGINTISLRRPSPAAALASTRAVSEPAAYGAEANRWSPGPGSFLSSKALTPQATSTQLDPRLSVMDASPQSHYIGTPGQSLQGHYPPTRSREPSSLVPPVRKAPVNPKRFCPQLCPGLVVPLGSECILAVRPISPMPSPRESAMATVEILDLCGKPVLKAVVCRVPKKGYVDSRSDSTPAVTLRMLESPHGRLESSVLATCFEDTDEAGCRQMRIHDANNKLFGHLGQDLSVVNRYMLRCTGGADPRDLKRRCTLSFEGVFGSHTAVIQNEYQEQLADSDDCVMSFNPSAKFYKLRVASGVDVGLMVVCMVCIDELEGQAGREPSCRNDGSTGGRSPWS